MIAGNGSSAKEYYQEVSDRFVIAQTAYARKIKTAAKNSAYVSPDHDVEDMEQELLIVLWDCCRKYDPTRGASFNAYFWRLAKQRIHRLKTRAKTAKRDAEVVLVDSETLGQLLNIALSAEEEYMARSSDRVRAGVRSVERQFAETLRRYAIG